MRPAAAAPLLPPLRPPPHVFPHDSHGPLRTLAAARGEGMAVKRRPPPSSPQLPPPPPMMVRAPPTSARPSSSLGCAGGTVARQLKRHWKSLRSFSGGPPCGRPSFSGGCGRWTPRRQSVSQPPRLHHKRQHRWQRVGVLVRCRTPAHDRPRMTRARKRCGEVAGLVPCLNSSPRTAAGPRRRQWPQHGWPTGPHGCKYCEPLIELRRPPAASCAKR